VAGAWGGGGLGSLACSLALARAPTPRKYTPQHRRLLLGALVAWWGGQRQRYTPTSNRQSAPVRTAQHRESTHNAAKASNQIWVWLALGRYTSWPAYSDLNARAKSSTHVLSIRFQHFFTAGGRVNSTRGKSGGPGGEEGRPATSTGCCSRRLVLPTGSRVLLAHMDVDCSVSSG
jgi:hypothetical protein